MPNLTSDSQVQLFGLYVAELFETNGRMGKRQETGAFKPVL